MAEDAGRISVSRDALRADLAQMELRLIQILATKDEVDRVARQYGELDDRVCVLERRATDEDAVQGERQVTFTKREKAWGIFLGTCALALQLVVVSRLVMHS